LEVPRGLNTSLEQNNGNVSFAVKQNKETTNHDIHPNYMYARILETGVRNEDKRLFLEALDSFLDKNGVNEMAPFPRVYASLVSSPRFPLHNSCSVHFSGEVHRRQSKIQF